MSSPTKRAGKARKQPPEEGGLPAIGGEIKGSRLLYRLAQLAEIGADPAGGVTRLAYSTQDVQARELVAGWMAEAGLTVWTDPAGNLLGRLPAGSGRPRALVLGSHLDTVVRGGPLDGAYGVLAAVEAADAVRTHGYRLRHDLLVAAFSNEEGARGTPGMVGSKAVTGLLTAADLARPDDEGVPLAIRIAQSGGDPERIAAAGWRAEEIAGCVELHIEQGTMLRPGCRQIGVVTAITGQAKADLTVTGEANHAGTTPLDRRRDAAVAAARLVLAVESLARQGRVGAATVGVLRTAPGVRNIIPSEAVLGVDLRDFDVDRITAAIERLRGAAQRIDRAAGVRTRIRTGPITPAVTSDPLLTSCVTRAAARLGAEPLAVHSGAGHDAQVLAALGPMAMVFVPSIGGVSHAPDEASDPADLVLGAQVLLGTVLEADRCTC